MTDAPRSLVERLRFNATEARKAPNWSILANTSDEAADRIAALEREVAELKAENANIRAILVGVPEMTAQAQLTLARAQVREQAAKAAEAAFAAHAETAWRFSLDGLPHADIISAAASAASIAAAIRAMPLEDSTSQPSPKPEM